MIFVLAAIQTNSNTIITFFFPLTLDSGECITCGDNSNGQLGYCRKTEGRCSPAVVAAGLSGREVERVACGDFFTLASTKGVCHVSVHVCLCMRVCHVSVHVCLCMCVCAMCLCMCVCACVCAMCVAIISPDCNIFIL